MKLSSFGNRYALAFALAVAGAVAACGGDDTDGMTTGAGGTGGVNPEAGKGGGPEASSDRGPDRATGGAAGTAGADSSAGGAAGTGGAGTDAAEAAPGTGGSPDAAPDVPRPPDAPPDVPRPPDAPPDVPAPVPDAGPDVRPDVVVDAGPDVAREAEAGPGPGSDATDVTPAVEAAPEPTPEPTPEPVPEAGPDTADGGATMLLYDFANPADGVDGWTFDAPGGTLSRINETAPGSLGGAIEASGNIVGGSHSVFIDFVDNGGPAADFTGFNSLTLSVRLHNAADASIDNVSSIQLSINGNNLAQFQPCAADVGDLSGGNWVTVTVNNCQVDGGASVLSNLKRIAVSVNLIDQEAGATTVALDVDQVFLSR